MGHAPYTWPCHQTPAHKSPDPERSRKTQEHFIPSNTMSKQSDLFSFLKKPKPVVESTPKHESKKTSSTSQHTYEAKRERKFVASWITKYPGIYEKDKQLFCKPCVDHPDISDPSSHLVTGTNSYRTGTLDKHWGSQPHGRAVHRALVCNNNL